MPDNFAWTEGSEQAIATDDIGGVHHERNKFGIGRNDQVTDWPAGTSATGAAAVRVRPMMPHAVFYYGNTQAAAHDYADGDAFSGARWELFRKRYVEGTTDYPPRILKTVTLIDTDGTEPDLDLFIHTSAWNPRDSDPFAPPRTALERVCGVISVATADWRSTATGSVYHWDGEIPLPQSNIYLGTWIRFTAAQSAVAQTYRIRAHMHMEMS